MSINTRSILSVSLNLLLSLLLHRWLSLSQLRSAGRINERSKSAEHSPAYSKIIRQGVPGW